MGLRQCGYSDNGIVGDVHPRRKAMDGDLLWRVTPCSIQFYRWYMCLMTRTWRVSYCSGEEGVDWMRHCCISSYTAHPTAWDQQGPGRCWCLVRRITQAQRSSSPRAKAKHPSQVPSLITISLSTAFENWEVSHAANLFLVTIQPRLC